MKNDNVYIISRDVEKKIKNGFFRAFITFSGNYNILDKISFNETYLKESTEDYPFEELVIKTKSPFRIGTIIINKIILNNVLKKNKVIDFDEKIFEESVKIICKKFKNTIIGLPLENNLIQFKDKIIKILNENVHNTKVVIIENK